MKIIAENAKVLRQDRARTRQRAMKKRKNKLAKTPWLIRRGDMWCEPVAFDDYLCHETIASLFRRLSEDGEAMEENDHGDEVRLVAFRRCPKNLECWFVRIVNEADDQRDYDVVNYCIDIHDTPGGRVRHSYQKCEIQTALWKLIIQIMDGMTEVSFWLGSYSRPRWRW